MKTRTSKTVIGVLDYALLEGAVRRTVPDAPWNATIHVWVEVPSGGEYSGCDIDLEEHQVNFEVSWTETDGE